MVLILNERKAVEENVGEKVEEDFETCQGFTNVYGWVQRPTASYTSYNPTMTSFTTTFKQLPLHTTI